jgi:nuclear receptor subfamily 6 group A
MVAGSLCLCHVSLTAHFFIFQQVAHNLGTLQTCLSQMMGRHITMEQLRQDVGLMVEKITHVTLMFRRVSLRMEEYVCLKVITMLNQG